MAWDAAARTLYHRCVTSPAVHDAAVDLLYLPGFLDRAFCARIVRELASLRDAPAPVYGSGQDGVQPGIRKVSRLEVPADLRETMRAHFENVRLQIEQHFRVALSGCEDPQFLHYRAGDFFVAHQDGNTPLIRDDTRDRRVSVVLSLNEQNGTDDGATYGGGDLVFHGAYPNWTERYPAPARVGSLIAFRSETTHEVLPVTYGDRYTIVTWYR